jgi:dCTP deaminase
MILCDHEIQQAINTGQIEIEPKPSPEQVQTTAVDLTLGSDFKRWVDPIKPMYAVIDVTADFDYPELANEYTEPILLERDGTLTIRPGQLILGITRERIRLPNDSRLAARIEGRSSLARIGLAIHLTAPTIHSGFSGKIALEITNNGAYHIRLRPGIRICQLIIEQVFGTPMKALNTVFQNQTTVLGSSPQQSGLSTAQQPVNGG